MNVERIQKVNNLARNLMQQGLAQNIEEAVSQAQKILHSNETEDYSNMTETMKEVQKEEQDDKENEEIELSQEKIKDILEQNTIYLVKKIKEFQEKIANLEKEITSMKTKITYQRLPTANQVVSEKEVVKADIVNNNENVPTNHPRSGEYNDKDVSIEKIFYMGNK